MEFEIPEPCEERWSSMEGRADGRYCARCDHVVLDLSTLTRREAERRIGSVSGDYVCVRIAADERGQAMFRPEPSRARHFAGGLVLVAALGAGCTARERVQAEAITEPLKPCRLDEPPMLPVDAADQQDAAPWIAEVSEIEAPSEIDPGEVVPTPEQQELTRRKQRGALGGARPVPVRHYAGRMPLRRR